MLQILNGADSTGLYDKESGNLLSYRTRRFRRYAFFSIKGEKQPTPYYSPFKL